MDNWQSLTEFGLTTNEAKIYLTLLEGECKLMQAAQRAQIHPKNAYVAIEGLERKGIVSRRREGRAFIFKAENPLVLKKLQMEKLQTLDLLTSKLLENKQSETPSVNVFKGKEGMQVRNQDLLVGLSEIRMISLAELAFLDNFYNISFRSFRRELKKSKRKLKIIDRDTKESRIRAKELDKNFEDIVTRKFWNGFKSQSQISWATSGETFSLAFFEKEPIYIRISSKAVCQSFNDLFDNLWRQI